MVNGINIRCIVSQKAEQTFQQNPHIFEAAKKCFGRILPTIIVAQSILQYNVRGMNLDVDLKPRTIIAFRSQVITSDSHITINMRNPISTCHFHVDYIRKNVACFYGLREDNESINLEWARRKKLHPIFTTTLISSKEPSNFDVSYKQLTEKKLSSSIIRLMIGAQFMLGTSRFGDENVSIKEIAKKLNPDLMKRLYEE